MYIEFFVKFMPFHNVSQHFTTFHNISQCFTMFHNTSQCFTTASQLVGQRSPRKPQQASQSENWPARSTVIVLLMHMNFCWGKGIGRNWENQIIQKENVCSKGPVNGYCNELWRKSILQGQTRISHADLALYNSFSGRQGQFTACSRTTTYSAETPSFTIFSSRKW